MKRVYVDMVADLFHFGHVSLLERAIKEGDYLIVGIHSDKTCESYKRLPIMTMKERIKVVSSCKYVDEVISDAPLYISKDYIKKHNIDIVIHAHSLEDNSKYEEMYKIPSELGIFRRIEYTPNISTIYIINRVKNRNY